MSSVVAKAAHLLQHLIRDVCAPLGARDDAPRGGDAAVAALPVAAMAACASTSSSRASAFSSVPAHCSARVAASPAPLTAHAITAHPQPQASSALREARLATRVHASQRHVPWRVRAASAENLLALLHRCAMADHTPSPSHLMHAQCYHCSHCFDWVGEPSSGRIFWRAGAPGRAQVRDAHEPGGATRGHAMPQQRIHQRAAVQAVRHAGRQAGERRGASQALQRVWSLGMRGPSQPTLLCNVSAAREAPCCGC